MSTRTEVPQNVRDAVEAQAPESARHSIADDHALTVRRWRSMAALETSPGARRVMDAYVALLEQIDPTKLGAR